jgi:hypothetical protein
MHHRMMCRISLTCPIHRKMGFRSSPPVQSSYIVPLGPESSWPHGRAIRSPDDGDYLVDVSPPPGAPPPGSPPSGYRNLGSPPSGFLWSDHAGPTIYTPSSTTQHAFSPSTVIYTPKHTSSSGLEIHTPSSTSQPLSSLSPNIHTPSSSSQYAPSEAEIVRPASPSPERIRDLKNARLAKPRANKYPGNPPPFAATEEFQQAHLNHPPPGYERLPVPAVR